MSNAMNVYIQYMAEEARKACVKAKIIEDDTCVLNITHVEHIVKFFDGKLEKVDAEELRRFSGNGENSILIKSKEEDIAKFAIKYVEFSAIDILHELGHAFLELSDMKPGDIRGCDDINGGLNELNATKFARAFIMPRALFEKKVVENSIEGKCNLQAVASAFKVEYLQVVTQGRQLQFWK